MEAALAGFDPRYARVVRVTFNSPDEAVVELATNEEPYLYPYFVYCYRMQGRWVEGDSHS
jgi:hypothetical protein